MRKQALAFVRRVVDLAMSADLPQGATKGVPLTLERVYNSLANALAGLQAHGDAILAHQREVAKRLDAIEARLAAFEATPTDQE